MSVSLFPNPTNENVYISIQGIQSDKLEINVLDLNGKKLKTQTINTQHMMTHDSLIELNDLSKGIYFIEVVTLENRQIKRLIIN